MMKRREIENERDRERMIERENEIERNNERGGGEREIYRERTRERA